MIRQFLILLSIIFLFSCSSSKLAIEKKLEENAKKDELNYDTNYIYSCKDQLTLKVYTSAKSNQLSQQGGIKREKVIYDVNRPYRVGLGVSYKWFNLSATLFSPVTNLQLTEKGETEHFDFRVASNGRSILADVWFQYFKGFYLSNTGGVIPNWNKPGIYYQRNDIVTTDFSGVVYYNIKRRKFSFKALFSQNEKQLKSAGTPIIGTTWSIFRMVSNVDSCLLPYNIVDHFKASERINRLRLSSLGLGVGYAYTFVFAKHWFFSIQGTFFVNSQSYRYFSEINPKGTLYAGFKSNFLWRSSLGYNSHKNYYGLVFIGNNVPLSAVNFPSRLDYIFNTLNFMYAHRFEIKKKMKNE